MNPHVEAMIRAAEAAGEVALSHYRTNLEVEAKADTSPVTIADREAEARIRDVLGEAFPDYGFFGEETGASTEGASHRWIVDPIDGTKSFIRGIPFFATLIGLEVDGEVVAGVVSAPAVGDLLWAARGEGAHDRSGERLRVSDVAELSASMVSFGGMKIFQQEGRWKAFERLVASTTRQRGFGDYLGGMLVARGSCEIMVELDVKPWDLAPMKILVEEAGGRMTDCAGEATIYGGSAVFTNGHVHDAVLEILR